jgi:putative endonuclease
MFYVYVIYSEKIRKNYTGHTDDIERRVFEHNNGLLGKYTRGKGPWKLIYSEEYATRTEAMKREKELKTGKGRDFLKQITRHSV